MTDLLRRPSGNSGQTHAITPQSAGWTYVGFETWRLSPGAGASARTGDREAILVMIEGHAEMAADGQDFGLLGDRLTVFDRKPPHCLYVPPDSEWAVRAATDCTVAVCSAPSPGGRPAQRLGPEGIALEERGRGTNTRYIHNIAMEAQDVADSLLVTEVYTPAGHWSSYPPHRHDVDDFPNITYLEETYYHRLNPSRGFGVQRVFTEDGALDETMAVSDHDVVLVPRGHHPCAAPHGIEMYYLNVMAGPRRNWRFKAHPDYDFIAT